MNKQVWGDNQVKQLSLQFSSFVLEYFLFLLEYFLLDIIYSDLMNIDIHIVMLTRTVFHVHVWKTNYQLLLFSLSTINTWKFSFILYNFALFCLSLYNLIKQFYTKANVLSTMWREVSIVLLLMPFFILFWFIISIQLLWELRYLILFNRQE